MASDEKDSISFIIELCRKNCIEQAKKFSKERFKRDKKNLVERNARVTGSRKQFVGNCKILVGQRIKKIEKFHQRATRVRPCRLLRKFKG